MKIDTANDLYQFAWAVCRVNRSPYTGTHIYLPTMICADGFRMSVQAGQSLYSLPREDGASYYACFEIGYPSEPEPLLYEYAEQTDRETVDYVNCVYPFVPEEVIDRVLQKHGGIVSLGYR